MVDGVVGACALLAVLGAVEGRAQACSPLPDLAFYPGITDGARAGVPTDGVIAFRAQTYGPIDEALALMTIRVTAGDVEIPGAIETVVVHDGGIDGSDLFVAWRPEAAFEAETTYAATIAVLDFPDATEPSVEIHLDVTTGDAVAGALPVATLADAVLSAQELAQGRPLCCEGDIGACGPTCVGEDLQDVPVLAATLAMPEDPMASQSFVRMLSGPEDALAPYAVLGIADGLLDADVQATFAGAAERYCVAAEVVSLVDGSVAPPVVACVDHGDLVLEWQRNPALDALVAMCASPYWGDTNEPYLPHDDDSGSDGGSDGGSEGGSADGGSDGGSADGGTADGGGDDAGASDDGDGKGCACDVDRGGSPASGLLLLLTAGACLGRRRRS